MTGRMLTSVTLLTCLAIALPASAQLTVATDKPEYLPGEIVHITIHNAGPSAAQFVSEPPLGIWHVATGECCFGCTGLPVVFDLAAGASLAFGYDPLQCPLDDRAGLYHISLAGSSPDPGSILSTTFTVLSTVDVERRSWGAWKSRFR